MSPSNVADWVTDRDSGVSYRFPAFTLGALLNPATLAARITSDAPPDTSTKFGSALHKLTGGKDYDAWVQGLTAAADVKSELNAADDLWSELNTAPTSESLPYTVRAVLAFLKIIAEHPDDILSGFSGVDSYEPYQFPFLVLFEAPDLTAGLLELFGLERPDYRSVRDIGVGPDGQDPFFEERAESLLVEMFDFCANGMVIEGDRFLRWQDQSSLATAARGVRSPLSGPSDFEIARGPAGSQLNFTGRAMGETTMWYCYSFGLSGCAGAWTEVTVLVEPDGWDDARVVIQRDHFHVVVDWNSGRVIVLRPSDSDRAVHTITPTGWPTEFNRKERGISDQGTWIGDAHERDYIPELGNGLKYEKVSEYCCLTDPNADFNKPDVDQPYESDWSFEVVLPVLDNDEVHFYDKPDPDSPAGPVNPLSLLAGASTCDTSRYCEHVRTHLLADRRKLPSRPEYALDTGETPTALTARINSRRTPLGTSYDLFSDGKKHKFDWFTLSYCVAPLNVDCLNWTDRRQENGSSATSPANPDQTKLKQGHCVIATSLRDPVAPNAPSELTVREWARRTGRPQGEFYFVRSFEAIDKHNARLSNSDRFGWNSARVVGGQQVKLRNYECPAVDPQNDRPDLDLTTDWKADVRRQNQPASPGSCWESGKKYDEAATLEYKAYRRFWNCTGTDGRTAKVVAYRSAVQRAAHPTEHNVFVTLEFINPTITIGTTRYPTQDDIDTSVTSANCASDGSSSFNSVPQPTEWAQEKWEGDPLLSADPDTAWCYPLVPCWNDAGERLKDAVAKGGGAPAKNAELAGCEPPTTPDPCKGFHQVFVPQSCTPKAADFALDEGCVAPGTTADRLRSTSATAAGVVAPGWGMLTSSHYRWSAPTYGGSFTANPGGGLNSSTARTAVDPGLPLFSVGAGLEIDPLWEFCQNSTTTVVGVWPTYPAPHKLVKEFPHWPPGACDGTDANPSYEIDEVCEKSYPRLYDSKRGKPGVQLTGRWKQCLEGAPGIRPTDSGCTDPKAVVPGCVGEEVCAGWVIPRPGFYRVRIRVDISPVPKSGYAADVATAAGSYVSAFASNEDPDALTQLLAAISALGGSVTASDLGPDPAARLKVAKALAEPDWGISDTRTKLEPFVFDTLIWAQSFFTGSA